jgi:Co/Zn/Cd efflux system component
MGSCCDQACHAPDPKYRRILWIALALNGAMFLVEVIAGLSAASTSLQADALDFLGDTGNYAISLFVIGMAASWRSKAALLKGVTMGVFGLWILANAAWSLTHGTVPEAFTMGWVGGLALAVNVIVAVLLYAFRDGDSNMQSVWLCSRNDAIGNLAVLLAAVGVFGTGTAWPDIAVAAIMGLLGLTSASRVISKSLGELRPATRSA